MADLLQQEKGKLLLVLTVKQKPCSAVLCSQSQQQDQKALCGVEASLDMSCVALQLHTVKCCSSDGIFTSRSLGCSAPVPVTHN